MAGESGPSSPADESPSVPDHGIDAELLNDLRDLLRPTKIRLLQQILASPKGALAAVELAARNEITESTIRDHLRGLEDRDQPIITTLVATTEGRVPHGIPRKYFAVTDYGIELLELAGQYEQIGILYDVYQAAELELPNPDDRPVDLATIESYEHRPSPGWY